MKVLRSLAIALALLCCAEVVSANTLQLLSNSVATGPQRFWSGGPGVFKIDGTWNGATVTLQYVGPLGNLQTAGSSCVFTSASTTFNCYFILDAGLIQATITGAGGSTSLTATVAAGQF